MNFYASWIAFYTIVRKEVARFMRIWSQTLLPPVINQTLYFVIFGTFIGSRVGDIGGVSYMAFIVPGLVMMAVINSAFANVVSSFFGAKFQKCIEELLVSPTPSWIITAGYVIGGMLRGVLVGLIVLAISAVFTLPTIEHPWIVLLFMSLTALVFAFGWSDECNLLRPSLMISVSLALLCSRHFLISGVCSIRSKISQSHGKRSPGSTRFSI